MHAANKYGNTSLHMAARNGSTVLMKALLDFGANVHAENKCKRTPLFCVARLKDCEEVTQLLIAAGAYVNAVDNALRSTTWMH